MPIDSVLKNPFLTSVCTPRTLIYRLNLSTEQLISFGVNLFYMYIENKPKERTVYCIAIIIKQKFQTHSLTATQESSLMKKSNYSKTLYMDSS